MKFISWSIRRLIAPHKQDIIHNMVRDHKPEVVLIQGTKMVNEKVENLKFFKHCRVVGSSFEGASGGTDIFWNLSYVKGEILDVDTNFVSVTFHHIRDDFS